MAPAKKITKEKKVIEAIELPIFSMDGKKVSTIALPTGLFSAPWRSDLVHQVVTGMRANLRQNRAHTKDRSEVAGGGKKPWKQKGTGQARHGSTRSPLWRHGGITFGPRSTRDYSEKINKKMRAAALASVLSKKVKDGEVILIDSLSFEAPKASAARGMLEKLSKGADRADLTTKKRNVALIALSAYNTNAIKSFRNFGNITTEEARSVNPLAVLSHKYLVIENPKESFTILSARAKKD